MKTNAAQLIDALARNPRATTAELCAMLGGINRSTLMRLLPQVDRQIIRLGQTRRSRYALRRPLRGGLADIPLYQLNEQGDGALLGQLALTHPEGSSLTAISPIPWPLDGEMRDGWFDGLPYFLRDMAPAGFLGRNFAHTYGRRLQIGESPSNWSDDEVIVALSLMGPDQPGNLILGDESFENYLKGKSEAEKTLVLEEDIATVYPQRAIDAMSNGVAGSSAAGEFPKFTAARWHDGRPTSVIVKFSGADNSASVQRWSDLLICEHLALNVLSESLGIQTAQSQIYQFEGRTFLEVERFDRVGLYGRVSQCTLSSIAEALLGQLGRWPDLAQGLIDYGFLPANELETVRRVWWFGKLIANSDMHEGNLSFRHGLSLAPIYDMLPMQYAPVRSGEVPPQEFKPSLPFPQESAAWQEAASAALAFWGMASADSRISREFQEICRSNVETLRRLADIA